MKRGGHKRQPANINETRKSKRRRARNRLMYQEAISFASELGIELAPSEPIPDVMEKIFRRTHALWLHAATEVDRLDPDAPAGDQDSIWTYKYDENGNKIVGPSRWIQLENALRSELFEQAAVATKLNLDEAHVRVEAAKLEVLSTALRNAVKAAGVPEELQRKIGAALRSELAIIEGQISDEQQIGAAHDGTADDGTNDEEQAA